MMKSGQIQYNSKPIPIIRVDVQRYKGNLPAEEKLVIDSVPTMMLYFKGKYFNYNDGYIADLFVNFMSRTIYPIIEIGSAEDVDRFINAKNKLKENSPIFTPKYKEQFDSFPLLEQSVRVIAFISNPKEYEEEMAKLANSAVGLNSRVELRVAKVVKPEIVTAFKQKWGEKFFRNNTSNSIVLLKYNKAEKGDIKIYSSDISTKAINYFNWINERSIEPVEEINSFSFRIISLIKKPFYIVFLSNSTNAVAFKSDTLLSNLRKIASQDPSIQILYTYSDLYKTKKRLFGITWDADPAFSFVFGPSQNHSVPFDQNKEMSMKNIQEYVSKINDGSLVAQQQQRIKDSLPKPKSFEEMCLEKGVDVLFFLYDSSIRPRETANIGKNFSKAAYRFKELKIELASFDVRGYELPEGLGDRKDLPKVFFFPAYHKDLPYSQFDQFSTEALMRRVEAEADLKFKLPPNPHMSQADYDAQHSQERAEDL